MREKREYGAAAGAPPPAGEAREIPAEPATYMPLPVPPPVPPAPAAGRRTALNPGNGWWALVATAAVIVIVIVAAVGFTAGYLVGNRKSSPAPPQGLAQQGQAGQRLQQFLQQRGESLIQGEVSSVSDGSVTVDTAKGRQTVSLTADTRFPGAATGAAGTGTGAQSLQTGESVLVVVKKTADGKMEAVAVRPRPSAQPAVPAQ